MRDKEGKPYKVRYDWVNAMLLIESLKEPHKVKSLEKTMAEQQRRTQSCELYSRSRARKSRK